MSSASVLNYTFYTTPVEPHRVRKRKKLKQKERNAKTKGEERNEGQC